MNNVKILNDTCDFLTLNNSESAQFDFANELNFFKSLRFNDQINLRSPIRNSIVTYNALQKVFRPRFDESRSHAKLSDYSSTYMTQPYVTSSRYSYEKLLSKNKENFFNLNFYKNKNLNSFNIFYDTATSTNFYTFDFPFLLGMKSDASKHI